MAVIDEILALIDRGAGADELLEGTLSVDSPELYERALADFGGWDAALAATLVYVRSVLPERAPASQVPLSDDPPPERTVTQAAHVYLHVLGRSGQVMNMNLDDVGAARAPGLGAFPEGPGAEHTPERLSLGVHDHGIVVITNRGQGVAVDARLLPGWERDALTRDLSHRFTGIERDEVAAALVPRRHIRDAERFYSLSVFGQIKASDASAYGRLSADAIPALLLKQGDALFDVFVGSKRTHVFVASSGAKAIVFSTADIRSQGRKATGVRAIGLDRDTRVVGAFDTSGHEWGAFATDRGGVKRVRLSEFRAQGRGGGGLQSCRLNQGDQIASAAPIALGGDVIVLSDRGRVGRFPAYDVPMGARASRAESLLSLADEERIVQILGVPAGNWL